MIFDRNEKKQVVALLGAGSMGTEILFYFDFSHGRNSKLYHESYFVSTCYKESQGI